MKGIVAIVGRPNVGKSTLFNRIVGERLSIVEDEAGVTRDRLYSKAEWLTKPFTLIDTGGIELKGEGFATQIQAQAEIAIEEADVIIMTVNGQEGLTNDDEYIASILHRSKKPIIVAVNMIDDQHLLNNIYDFYQLGLGDPIAVSSVHGIGIGDLLDQVIQMLPSEKPKEEDYAIRFSIIGRPNVGKSSMTNALLGQERVIVSDVAGTTRDAIDVRFKKDGIEYVAVDTAGMKRKGKIYEKVEKYAMIRAMSAIENSDVVLVVIDGHQGIIDQDKHIAGYAHEAGKPIVLVVNKWDLVEKETLTMKKYEAKIREQFKYLDYAPIVFVSALEGKRLHQLFPMIVDGYENSRRRIQTSVLNEVLVDAQAMNPTVPFNGGRLKIYFGNQVSVVPPTFVLFVNQEHFAHFSYLRYIENQLRLRFAFDGTPIRLIVRKRT